MRVRPVADPNLGWAYRPDAQTLASLSRGTAKLKKAKFVAGVEKPHEGGNLAEALAAERSQIESKRKRRRRMARKVNLKELNDLRKGRLKKTASSKKKTAAAPTGRMIPLKAICSDMDLDPKATRIKLRRLIAKGEINFHDHSARWEFTPAQAKVVRSHLAE